MIGDLLLQQALFTGEGDVCAVCNDKHGHRYYLRTITADDQGNTYHIFTGLECVPRALGHNDGDERGRYVTIPSRTAPGRYYRVWTGDCFNAAHCPCDGFRYADRAAGIVGCRHIAIVRAAQRRGLLDALETAALGGSRAVGSLLDGGEVPS